MDQVLNKSIKLWQLSKQQQNETQLFKFIEYISGKYKLVFNDYHEFYNWSITQTEYFWQEFLNFSKIILSKQPDAVLIKDCIFNKSRLFPGAKLNFAQNLLESHYNQERLKKNSNYTALISVDEQGNHRELTLDDIKQQVACLVGYFRSINIQQGDRIVGLLPNMAETIIAMLATTAVGAVWSACSPDFGEAGILERFVQISPKLILVTDGYYYKNKYFDTSDKNAKVINSLKDNLLSVISINKAHNVNKLQDYKHIKNISWDQIQKDYSAFSNRDIDYTPVDFNDPVYIMFSSGTTGQPKCIVHGVGGILTEHFKEHLLHNNLNSTDNFLYFTTTSWMMWHWQVSGLGLGATLVIYDGAPNQPNLNCLLDLIDKYSITIFGASAKYFSSLEKANIKPKDSHSLSSLRMLLSTGSPLVDEQYDYIYNYFKSDVALCSISGGTDIIGCFALGNPLLPIYKGELQCRSLGLDVRFFNDQGIEVIGEKGELVCLAPFPSMPIYFWNDPDGSKYHQAYFNKYANIWAHGDYGALTQQQGVRIYGRSDAVLNPGGVRIGTAEIYAEVEKIPEVIESLAVGQLYKQDERIVLFVVLRSGMKLSDELITTIKTKVKQGATPRHVPAVVIQVPELPRTTSGKLVELAVKNVISGIDVKNKSALANPKALEYFEDLPELR